MPYKVLPEYAQNRSMLVMKIKYCALLVVLAAAVTGCRTGTGNVVLKENVFLQEDTEENISESERQDSETDHIPSEDTDSGRPDAVPKENAADSRTDAVPPENVSEDIAGAGSDLVPPENIEDSEEEETARIYVYVCGAVVKEGVYALPEGARVYEAVEAAGGLQDSADVQQLNMASMLRDEDMICIPRTDVITEARIIHGDPNMDSANVGPGRVSAEQQGGRININTAGAEELMKLAGIGQVRANAILDYREQNGPFSDVEEIMRVPGIKASTFEKIKEEIYIE